MRVAYADPPYLGKARKHYSHDPKCAEVDHDALLAELGTYDAWALSCNSSTLYEILHMPNCPPRVRIGAWVKPFAVFKPNVSPAYAWEPVLFQARKRSRYEQKPRDWVSANAQMKSELVGQKPRAFCYWLFELLGMQPGDEFVDLFPGTGAVSRAWKEWRIAQLDKTTSQPLFTTDS